MIWNRLRRRQGSDSTAYSGRVRQELSTYNEKTDVHDLPQIFHYVSNKYWRPRFEALGIRGINEFYADYICALSAQRGRRIDVCSVGAGNCDTEVAIARLVKDGE